MKTVTMRSLDDLDVVAREIRDMFDEHGEIEVAIIPVSKKRRKRTLPQNAALHLYCSMIAEKMNDAGYTQRQLVGKFKEGFELPTTPDMIKSIFREIGKAMFKKESTKDLTTIEMQEVYRVIDQRFGEITGCRAEWPSLETYLNEGLTR